LPFKELADRKSEIFDEDILALVSDESVTAEKEHYGFISLAQRSETGEQPHAEIVFTAAGKGAQPRRRQRPGGRVAQGDRGACQERRRDGAVFGQRHQRLDRRRARSPCGCRTPGAWSTAWG
jgi:hypothetical protein